MKVDVAGALTRDADEIPRMSSGDSGAPNQPWQDPVEVNEPGSHPPLPDLPDNDPASPPNDVPPAAPPDGPTPDISPPSSKYSLGR
jgi:hypothetical protein